MRTGLTSFSASARYARGVHRGWTGRPSRLPPSRGNVTAAGVGALRRSFAPGRVVEIPHLGGLAWVAKHARRDPLPAQVASIPQSGDSVRGWVDGAEHAVAPCLLLDGREPDRPTSTQIYVDLIRRHAGSQLVDYCRTHLWSVSRSTGLLTQVERRFGLDLCRHGASGRHKWGSAPRRISRTRPRADDDLSEPSTPLVDRGSRRRRQDAPRQGRRSGEVCCPC